MLLYCIQGKTCLALYKNNEYLQTIYRVYKRLIEHLNIKHFLTR